MAEEHTEKVMTMLHSVLRDCGVSKSPMTYAAAALGTSYTTLRRRMTSGKLSLNDFEKLCTSMHLDPVEIYTAAARHGTESPAARRGSGVIR